MAFYTGIDCPVCGKPFEDGEDIVTCPVCGTPSHRSCYEKLGRCVHEEKHAEGFAFDITAARKQLEPKLEKVAADSKPHIGAAQENGENASKETTAAPSPVMPFFGGPSAPMVDPFLGSSEKIDGEKIGDVATVVRTNIPFYLKKFKKMDAPKRRLSWNWGAFIFGPYWYFYRRMSKYGGIFMAIQLILQILIQAIFASNLNQFAELMNGAFSEEARSQMLFYANPENVQKAFDLGRQANLLPYFITIIAVMLVLRLAFSLLANSFYKSHCLGVVRKVRTQIDDPQLLERFTAAGYPVKTKTELLRMYLTQMGGTSLFSALIGYMGYNLVITILGMIL